MRKRSRLAIAAAALLLLGPESSAAPTAASDLSAEFVWTTDDPLFGGFSAIDLDDSGLGFVALSDRGAFLRGRLIRDAEGRIVGVQARTMTRLRGDGAGALRLGRTDSEGLAVGADGVSYVSFEGVARVLRYATLDGPAENLPQHSDFRAMQVNSALEALAIGPDGTLYTLPERSGALVRHYPVYRFRAGVWDKSLSIPRKGTFLAVSADIGPDGRFYLLERKFLGLSGFASRLRRFDIGTSALSGEVTLLETPVGRHDNLEGLSVWRDTTGDLRATMISDNNFYAIFRTWIVEYHLPD